jgi:hypothetical protein
MSFVWHNGRYLLRIAKATIVSSNSFLGKAHDLRTLRLALKPFRYILVRSTVSLFLTDAFLSEHELIPKLPYYSLFAFHSVLDDTIHSLD